VRFNVLGPIEARSGDRVLVISGGRQLALLGLLLVHAGEMVSRDRLIDELWAGNPPASGPQPRRLRAAAAAGVA
jgi:DNA-binding SARP family transcriptional activator